MSFWLQFQCYVVIGGEIGGAEGARAPPPPHIERRGAEPPHFSNVYAFQYALHNTKKPQKYSQKHSLRVENSKF